MNPIHSKALIRSTLIALFIFSSSVLSGMGMSDWRAKTPYGNEMNFYLGQTFNLQNGKHLDNLGEWFFYKKHSIGKLGETRWIGDEGWLGDALGYFVASELSSRKWTFNNQKEWNAFLNNKIIQPYVITRWFYGEWAVFNDHIYWIMFYGFFVFCFSIYCCFSSPLRNKY